MTAIASHEAMETAARAAQVPKVVNAALVPVDRAVPRVIVALKDKAVDKVLLRRSLNQPNIAIAFSASCRLKMFP